VHRRLGARDCPKKTVYRAMDPEVVQLKWTKMTDMIQGMSLLGREIVPVFVPGERGCSQVVEIPGVKSKV